MNVSGAGEVRLGKGTVTRVSQYPSQHMTSGYLVTDVRYSDRHRETTVTARSLRTSVLASATYPGTARWDGAKLGSVLADLSERNVMGEPDIYPYIVTVPIKDGARDLSVVSMQILARDYESAEFIAECRTEDEGYEIDRNRPITSTLD